MHLVIAFILIAVAVAAAHWGNKADRPTYDQEHDDRLLILHIRQDLKVIVFMLAVIAILLGVIAGQLA